MTQMNTLVIGAGMTGLACARALGDAGHAVAILDKGRGIGGRLATRRTPQGWQFDHGAQYVTAKTDAFGRVLSAARAAKAAALWPDGSGRDRVVGIPGMSGLAKHLAGDAAVQLQTEVTGLSETDGGWRVRVGDTEHHAKRVVLTVPAPQACGLLGQDHPLSARIAKATMVPCLALMAVVDPAHDAPFVTRRDPDDPIAWIADNSTKPGRPGPGCWVAQAGPAFSRQHLEGTFDEIAALMLPMLCDRLGVEVSAVVHAAAHRWRYANVATPLGRAFISNAAGTLHVGGDWCLGPRVEAAWTSGTAIAQAILGDA